ncbi:metal ABC transporter ATP-binding protein [Pseudoramibacter alactolyticus]|uniref:metal ABC transporter ATP-binding protein n=1 Tax=Pseudoramibacter alactolyticus TaxID=113287 RepID=UPI00248EAD04|nr:ABC transporter ATP-binding protein [Pseudoramibacter alactolyticus]
MNNSIVTIEDMTMAYHDAPVLWDVDIQIPAGSRTAIIGPNGAGKSTLLRGILGLQRPLSGKVLIDGLPIKKALKKIAYIPQTGTVNWHFPTNVLDVVLMGRYNRIGWIRRPGRRDRQAATRAIEIMGLTDLQHRQIAQLSGGQRQRVFIARAIAQDAGIYLMDEPLAGVDKKTEGIIIDFIKTLQKEGRTTIVVHHDLNTLADYFDHVVILNRNVIAQGPVSDVLTPANLERAMMVGGSCAQR